jgi:hypothetical protein
VLSFIRGNHRSPTLLERRSAAFFRTCRRERIDRNQVSGTSVYRLRSEIRSRHNLQQACCNARIHPDTAHQMLHASVVDPAGALPCVIRPLPDNNKLL